jgi:lipoate synthase
MKTVSQKSFVARLARAEQLFQHVNSYSGYNPGTDELALQALNNLITEITATHTLHTTTHHDFAEAAKQREKIFTSNPDSVARNMTLVKAHIKARKGGASQQYIDVNNLVQKMRGSKPTKITKNATELTISNTEKSYGSQLQNFASINELLTQFGSDYNPANNKIVLENLRLQFQQANTINNEVTLKYGAFKPTIAKRQNIFKKLLETASRIKEAVKSQYGTDSSEYKLIKGLRF